MEGLKHFSHRHPLILSKYNDFRADALCYGCNDPVVTNTYVYQCTTLNYPCTKFFLHETCANLPRIIKHDFHNHMLHIQPRPRYGYCKFCFNRLLDKRRPQYYYASPEFVYRCARCIFDVCLKCALPERELNHPSHNHTLTLLPLKASHICVACGTNGSRDFSYLCKTCLFWIHKSCASAPPKLMCEVHDNDHPLVLDYSLPEEYQKFGVSCNLCPEVVHPLCWLYYCAGCRYFAHVKCALSAAKYGKYLETNEDEGDEDASNLVHFPSSENEPYLLYKLIQQFAKSFSTATDARSGKADKIFVSHCYNGHSLILFDDFNDRNVSEIKNKGKMLCNGCVQPLLSPSETFYGCLVCQFFLHGVCAAGLPRKFQHALHPESKLVICRRFQNTPLDFFVCDFCEKASNGISYKPESEYGVSRVDIVCAAMPSKIKHDSHKHTLHHLNGIRKQCNACSISSRGSFFGCKICDYHIHIICARKPGTYKHRWDEHQLLLMYPPVKGHPHDFNCELCSEDINPNYWFYHCRKCDTSFHTDCLHIEDMFPNIKFGAIIIKIGRTHEHSLELNATRHKFKCGCCHINRNVDGRGDIRLKCVSCEFSECSLCITNVAIHGTL